SPPGPRGRATLTRSVSEGCRKSVGARRQRPRLRFGLVCRTTQAAELDQRKPNFLVVFSEKCPVLCRETDEHPCLNAPSSKSRSSINSPPWVGRLSIRVRACPRIPPRAS